MKKDLTELENKLGIKFRNPVLLQQALIHRSFLNENSQLHLNHNERLEFLGDAVLELVVTEFLYGRYESPEGELTNWRAALVKRSMLAEVAKELTIGEYLYLSKGEEKTGGRFKELILANALEAIIGAIYLDQGLKTVRRFLQKTLLRRLKEILEKELYVDAKSKLQELTQERWGVVPVYKTIAEYGPDHNKSFVVGVYLKNKLLGQGTGSSKQTAEQAAASAALDELKKQE